MGNVEKLFRKVYRFFHSGVAGRKVVTYPDYMLTCKEKDEIFDNIMKRMREEHNVIEFGLYARSK